MADSFDFLTSRDELLRDALTNANWAAEAAHTAGLESLPADDFRLAVGQASAYSAASLAYSRLLAVTVPADFEGDV
jgi:hypothetical protein